MNSKTQHATKPVAPDACWHWTKQAHLEGQAALLRAAGGDETKAAQIHAWAQNPEYRGKETLVAKLYSVQGRAAVLRNSPGGSPAARETMAELRELTGEFAAHRTAFTALPPRTIVDGPPDPMRPVPNVKNMTARAKAELPSALVANMKARGFEYVNTATLVNIRHGQTDGNVVSGGYFAGGLPGPWGAQLTAQAKDAASRLVPELRSIAPDIGAVIVSPTDRALETYARATQGVNFPKGTPVTVEASFAEHNVGGMFGLKKPAKGNPTVVSKKDGLTYGRTEDGAVGVDKNPAGKQYVPPVEPFLTTEPRMAPVRSEGRSESWEQMYGRVSSAVERDILPQLADGKNVLVVSHQFVIGNQDAFFFNDAYQPGVSRDPIATGHALPNTAPQYWPMHVFRDVKSGKLVVVPAIGGQGQLAAPGVTPSNQNPRTP
jgi:broad specificity phosphatase PhoE